MKKRVNKFTKILLLMAMIISDLMTPIKVLADEITEVTPDKGDVGISDTVSDDDSVIVSMGGLTNEGDVQVTKKVSKTDTEGRYKIEFNIKGKEVVDSSEITKPVYVVVVFDRSGSMEEFNDNCIDYDSVFGYEYCVEYEEVKFSAAVAGARTFANKLLEKIPSANIGLVTFAYTARKVRGFDDPNVSANANLDDVSFGSPSGGTNLHDGLIKANEMLSSTNVPADANKYVVVIGDGQPTYYIDYDGDYVTGFSPYDDRAGNTTNKLILDATYGGAETLKDNNVEIFSIGYSLPTDTVYDDTKDSSVSVNEKYGALTAADILTDVASEDTEEDIENGISHYIDSSPNAIVKALNNIATEISRIPAGTNATLTDNIGSKFKIVGQEGNAYTSEVLSEITETGTTISFEVEIDESKVTEAGWYNTNDGFSLTYTDANGNEQTISLDENPQVYWTPTVYNYTVNYYKDSFDTVSIASENRETTNGTVINASNVDKDKYLNNSTLGTVGYELNTINPESITIDSNGKTINVLYTIKKFNYTVEFYYDGVLENTVTENNIDYGTTVDATTYYDDGAREGYSLDTTNSTSGNITIDTDNEVIKVYYKKNSYGYTINYHFNNIVDTDFTKIGNSLLGTTIKAEDNYLNDSELNDKNTEDNTHYFINPSYPSNQNEIVIGANSNENIINIYYVSTVVTNEDMSKTSNTDKITSGDTEITYTVEYTSVVNNIKKGDTVKVVITDTLPLEIDLNKSTLNGGVYDSDAKTITWTFEETMTEFTEEFDASKIIAYTVVYKNVGNGDGSTLINNVVGQTTAGGKTTIGEGNSSTIEVEIPAEVIVHHYVKGTTNSVANDEKITGQVGEIYTTNYKTDILGYTVDMEGMPSNANGTYTENAIEVTYYYTKNDGTIENTDVVKTSKDSDKVIDSVNSIFSYTIDAYAEVKDYVGKTTLKVVDELPYALDTEKSNIGNCTYNSESKTITCTKEYTIAEEDYTINSEGGKVFVIDETFTLDLVFTHIDSETVTNTAKVEVILDDSKIAEEDNDTEDVKVEKGTVTATYEDTEGNTLHNEVITEGLVGNSYTTEEKTFFGYTLTETPENKDGIYTKEDTIVEYIYTKDNGSIDNINVVKTSKDSDNVIDSVNSIFSYTIDAYGEVKDYVGKATLKVVDELPYSLDAEKSNIGNCTYDRENKTVTCTKEYTIAEEDYTTNNEDEKIFVIDETFTLDLVFKGVDSETVTNNATVEIILDDSKITGEDNDPEDVKVAKGTVVVTYKDTEGNTLNEDVTTTDLAGTSYTTETKEFYGYNLVEVPSNKEGTYLANQTITVDYVYSKNDGKIENTNVEKVGPDSIDSIDKEFNYTFKYSATINEYTGKVTLKLVDTLPFKAIITSKDNACQYDGDLTIVCEKEYDITKVTTINEEFNVTLKYIGIEFEDINTSTILTNGLIAELTYGENKITNSDEKETMINIGTVVATYKDLEGNTLHSDVTITDLAGTSYRTEEKTFFGYTLTEEPSNKEGTYLANQTIVVNYIYSKNDGSIDNTDITKTSIDEDKVIDSVNSVFGYSFDAYAEVKDYLGKATLKAVDTLPYEIDIENSNIGNCTYNSESKTITCTKEYTIAEEDYTINSEGGKVFVIDETFTLDLVFTHIDSETVTNTAKVEVILDDSKIAEEDNDTEDVKVEKGTVTATYEDTDGNTLHNEVITEGLVGNSYTTEEKTFFGYTLTETPENKDGIYTKEDTIVEYIYTKDNGSIDNTNVVKTFKDSDNVIDSVNSIFSYTIDAYGEVKDYVGDVTLKVVDELPYSLDAEKSNIGNCTYDRENKTVTCTKEYTIAEEDYTTNNEDEKIFVIDETFTLDLVFKGVDSETVTNTAKVEIILDDSKIAEEDNDIEDVKVANGTVVATYKDLEGNVLHEDVTTIHLAGTVYRTDEKEFYGYTLTKEPSNKEGTYLANQTIIVNYVYSKNIGTSEEELIKYGNKDIDEINSEFEYTISYNTTITDFVGEVTLVIIDELPYDIDKEKSVYDKNNCQYTDGKLVCTYKKNITEEDNMFNIVEYFTLYYINITDSKVTNRVTSKLTYGTTIKVSNSEYTSEVKQGTVIVNYTNKNGDKLTDSITLTGLVGDIYTSNKKIFDKYNLIEVEGEKEGKYIDGVIEVTYVYDLVPLPPQTGIDFTPLMFIKYLVYAAILVVSGKTYKLIKNN